jgi:hypothetical protein
MAYPSYAPAKIIVDEEDDALIARPRTKLRLSRMPASFAVIAKPMPLVADTFRRLGTEPPGRPMNDDSDEDLDEDQLFAIWQARLL